MKSLVEKWKTDGNYEEGLELLKLIAPGHRLLPVLERGVSAINRIYLHKAINDLDLTKASKQQAKEEKTPKNLYAQLRQLYVAKAKRRNQFFEVGSNIARKEISDDLIDYRRQIHDLSRHIEYFKKTGQLIKISEQKIEAFDLSNDLFQLGKDLTNTRSNISKTKKRLKEADEARAKKEIEKYELKLKTLERKRDAIEQRIKHIREKESQ